MSTPNHKPATTSDILPGTTANNPSSTPSAKEDQSHPASGIQNPESSHSSHPASSIQNPASASPPSTPDTRHSTNPFALRARCGKVARLPKEIRDQLNEMLLDGVPHAKIIQILRAKFGTPATTETNVVPIASGANEPDSAALSSPLSPSDESGPATFSVPLAPSDGERAGVRGPSSASDSDHASSPNPASSIQHPESSNRQIQPSINPILESLTPHHITTWKKYGGYRDWLKDQQRLEECKLRHELTLDLARSAEGLASYQAAPKVAVAQICQTIIDIGPGGLKDAMKESPLNCFRLLNALARLINSGLKCENQIQKNAIETYNDQRQPINRAELRQIELDLNLL